jgi:hypothetical protein
MSSLRWLLLSVFGGGIAFWIPDVLVPALDHSEQGYAVTAACPIALILFYVALLRRRREDRFGPSTAIFALCGIWVLALSFAMLAQTVRGNGFSGGAWTWGDFGYLLVSSFLPTRVVEFLTLEGSIIAVWLGTIAMIICHFAFERGRWIVPPSLWPALNRNIRGNN